MKPLHLDDFREAVADVSLLVALLAHATRGDDYLRGVSYDHSPAPATPEKTKLPPGVVLDDTVGEILASWAQMWEEAVGLSVSDDPAETLAALAPWAYRYPDDSAWADACDEVLALRTRLRKAYGYGDRTISTPCLWCGEFRLVQPVSSAGYADRYECKACDEAVDTARYDAALAAFVGLVAQ